MAPVRRLQPDLELSLDVYRTRHLTPQYRSFWCSRRYGYDGQLVEPVYLIHGTDHRDRKSVGELPLLKILHTQASLSLGNGDLTLAEQRTHFAAWVFFKSPILLGTDVRVIIASAFLVMLIYFWLQLANLNSTQLEIIKNPELLAFHQDPSIGEPAKPFTPVGYPGAALPEFYSGKSTKGTHVFVLNLDASTANKTFDFASIPDLSGTRFNVHDMWSGRDLGVFNGSYNATIGPHDNAALLITPA